MSLREIDFESPIRKGLFFLLAYIPIQLAQNAAMGWGDSVIAELLPGIHTWWGWALEMAVTLLAAQGLLTLITPRLKDVWWFPFPAYLSLSEAAKIAYETSRKYQPAHSNFANMADAHARRESASARLVSTTDIVLDDMAGYMRSMVNIYGKHPPSDKYEYLGNLNEDFIYTFTGGATVASKGGSPPVNFTDLVIKKKDINKLKRFFMPE